MKLHSVFKLRILVGPVFDTYIGWITLKCVFFRPHCDRPRLQTSADSRMWSCIYWCSAQSMYLHAPKSEAPSTQRHAKALKDLFFGGVVRQVAAFSNPHIVNPKPCFNVV